MTHKIDAPAAKVATCGAKPGVASLAWGGVDCRRCLKTFARLNRDKSWYNQKVSP